MEKILGEDIEGKDRKPVAVKTLADNELVGLYFSAKWCSPCRLFTPILTECYNKLKDAGKTFQVVFISFDGTETECMQYYKDMPWLLFPYKLHEEAEELAKKFDVKGIPTLLLFNPKTGDLIRADGREVVTKDPEGKDFPWRTCKV